MTGAASGKTRTAFSIADVLLRYKWAKRILFLADRNPLVKQAYKSFSEHLPDVPIVNLVEEKNDTVARIIFSTNSTILNQIEKLKGGDCLGKTIIFASKKRKISSLR
ncbi:MAG: DEAD/DEAH box helicase family protein [Balneolales bacterium]|nr:DEAD/DEAH box helicase family protein [Balneolales bacterium]